MLKGQANRNDGGAETLTDGSFHEHRFRVRGTGAVSSCVDGLDPEHVVCPSNQAVTHEPGGQHTVVALACFLVIFL